MKKTVKVLTIVSGVCGSISAILTGVIGLLRVLYPPEETPPGK